MNIATKKTIKKLAAPLSVLLVLASLAGWTWGLSPSAGASSHREAPLTSKDPTVDNTDVFAFVSPDDPSKITLIANWIPFEEPAGGPNFYHFDDLARYLIKIDRDGDAVEDVTYEWTFRQDIRNPDTFLYNTGPITSLDDPDFNYRQFYRVREIVRGGPTTTLGSDLLMPPDNIGPRSTPDYEDLARQAVRDLGGGIREFTGQRDDPFYVDVGSIFDLLGLRPFNEAHRIRLDNARGVDTTGGFNIHTTAIQVPRSRLAPDCNGEPSDRRCVIGVWSTAERRSTIVRGVGTRTGSGDFVQVSRLGNPLVNEVVINLELKDTFNGAPPSVDRTVPEIVARVTDPELGRLIEQLYPGIDVPPAPRDDLVAVFLTGIEGLNQQVNSRATPSEQLRLNTAIRPTAEICRGNVLGVLAGDNAGFPNGRRIEDDVTDIEIRAVAGGYALTPSFNRSPNNQLGDGLDENDLPCLSRFPYLATPHQGYEHPHHQEGDDGTDNGNDNAVAGVEKKQIEDDDDDDQERKLTEEQRQQKQRTNRSNRSDYVTEGNVVGVRCDLAAPVPTVAVGFIAAPEDVPYALIALVDGVQQVRLRAEAAGQCGAIRPGDYLFADGTKENEQLFDAESVELRRNGRRIS